MKITSEYKHKYLGDSDMESVHFGAFNNGVNIGIVSLMKKSNPLLLGKQMQLRGMAVALDVQQQGVGKKLIAHAIAYCAAKKVNLLWCNAREKAVGFYKKQDFAILGEQFFIEDVCFHYLMYRKII